MDILISVRRAGSNARICRILQWIARPVCRRSPARGHLRPGKNCRLHGKNCRSRRTAAL